MSDSIGVALIALFGVAVSSASTVIAILVKKDVKDIHILLNSQRDILLANIKNLEAEVRELKRKFEDE